MVEAKRIALPTDRLLYVCCDGAQLEPAAQIEDAGVSEVDKGRKEGKPQKTLDLKRILLRIVGKSFSRIFASARLVVGRA